MVLELYRRHPGLVRTLILVDTCAGWKGSLPAEEVRARVVIPRCGHVSNLERPGEFNAAVRAFCRSHEPPDQRGATVRSTRP